MQRFTILEGWRALLAWWVVLSHTLALSGFSRGDIVQNVKNSEVTGFDIGGWFMHLWYEIILLARSGKIPVYVFVMMSGFVIVHLLLMKKEPYNIYIMRRFLRLWPALMFVLVLYAVTYLIGMPVRSPDNFWGHFFLEATMLHGLVPNEVFANAAHALSGPGWSISLEWQFYILAPFILAALTKGGWRGMTFVAFLFVALFFGALNTKGLNFMGESYNWNHPAALPHLLGFFGLGMASYYLFRKVGESKIKAHFPLIGMAAAAFLAVGFMGPEGRTPPMLIWVLVFASLITSGSWMHKLIDSKPLHWLGNMSYSTYITHMFVLTAVHRFVIRHMAENDTLAKFFLTVGISWPLIMVVSMVSYYWIEKPAINFGRKLAKKWEKKPESAETAG